MKKCLVFGGLMLILLGLVADAFCITCFYRGERTETYNKICFYDCLGDSYAVNIDAWGICPVTIEVDR